MGLKAFISDLTKLPQKTASLDTVYGWMVLEHVHNIDKLLSEINRTLKPKGNFCFSVPNAGSWELPFFKKYWHGLHLPNHLYHFTPASLTQILNKNSFTVTKIIHQKTFSNVASSSTNYIKESQLPSTIKNFLLKILKWNSIIFFTTNLCYSKIKYDKTQVQNYHRIYCNIYFSSTTFLQHRSVPLFLE